MSNDEICPDTESSSKESANTQERNVILGLPANSTHSHAPPIIRRPATNITQISTTIINRVEEATLKIDVIRAYVNQLHDDNVDVVAEINQLEMVMQQVKSLAILLRR